MRHTFGFIFEGVSRKDLSTPRRVFLEDNLEKTELHRDPALNGSSTSRWAGILD